MSTKQSLFLIRLAIGTALFSFLLPFGRSSGGWLFHESPVQISGLRLMIGASVRILGSGPLRYWFPSLFLAMIPLICAMVSTYRAITIKGYKLNPKHSCIVALVFLGVAYLSMGVGQLYGIYVCAGSTLLAAVLSVVLIEKDAQPLPGSPQPTGSDAVAGPPPAP